MPGPSPAVTLIVPTYNSAPLLPAFFDALPAALAGASDAVVVVADNASDDDTVAVVARCWPDAVVVELGANRGYSASINASLAAAPPDRAAFVLNPDIRLGSGCVERLLGGLEVPGTGIAVPRLYERDGSTAYSLRREASTRGALLAALVGGVRAGRIGDRGELISDPDRYEVTGTADWASGAALLISRQCLDAVGHWDESFFLYSEDAEFVLRARDAGFALRYVPEATAVHLGGPSHENPGLWALSCVNKLRLYERRRGWARARGFQVALALNEALRWARGGGAAPKAALLGLLRPSTVPAVPLERDAVLDLERAAGE